MDESDPPKKKVIAYIDGFNLYYGLCAGGFRRYLWLDVESLAKRLIRTDQELVATKYYTSRISGGKPSNSARYAADRDAKRSRQAVYLAALRTLPGVEIRYGQFLEVRKECTKCGSSWVSAEEKMTDVNIATDMVVDAFASRFDVALLISGDSDLTPPIKAIQESFPHKRINIALPPKRKSHHLKQVANGECDIHRNAIRKSQLPLQVVTAKGGVLTKPSEWV